MNDVSTISEYGPAIAPALLEGPVAAESVLKLEPIDLPVDKLRAALICAGKDESRYYLNGVYVHRTDEGFVRAVATDGHRLMVTNLYREYADQPGPAWLDKGVIIPADGLAARLALIAKSHGKSELPLTVAYADESAKIEITDARGESVFRLAPVDGTFPDYQQIMAGWSGEEKPRGDWAPTGFDPKYLKSIADIANRLGAKGVECFSTNGKGDDVAPALFTFSGVGGIALFLMPRKVDEQIAAETQQLLAPSIRLTLAALKAHETRNRKAAKKLTGQAKDDATTKADEFKARIDELMKRFGTGEVAAALPAPQPVQPEPPQLTHDAEGDGEEQAPEGDEVVNEEPAAEEQAAPEEQPQVEEPTTTPRGRKNGSKAKARKARKNLH